MGSSTKTAFCLVGQFLGYELKGHKIQRVHLRQGQEEYSFKVNSDARSFLVRAYLEQTLEIGDWLEVSGVRKENPKKGVRFKAQSLSYTNCPSGCPVEPITPQSISKTKILVCQKSSCCKRGGKGVMKQLQQVVGDRHLDGQVSIKGTGCMGKCSQGPVMVIDKTHYRQVEARKIPRLLEQHVNS